MSRARDGSARLSASRFINFTWPPDNQRDRPIRWLRWLLVMMIHFLFPFVLSFLSSVSFSPSLFFFSSFLGRKNWLLAAQSVNRTRCERSGIIGTIRIEHRDCFWKLCAWNRIYLYFLKKKLETFDDFVTSKVLEMFRLHFLVIVSEKSWNCRDIILFH